MFCMCINFYQQQKETIPLIYLSEGILANFTFISTHVYVCMYLTKNPESLNLSSKHIFKHPFIAFALKCVSIV